MGSRTERFNNLLTDEMVVLRNNKSLEVNKEEYDDALRTRVDVPLDVFREIHGLEECRVTSEFLGARESDFYNTEGFQALLYNQRLTCNTHSGLSVEFQDFSYP